MLKLDFFFPLTKSPFLRNVCSVRRKKAKSRCPFSSYRRFWSVLKFCPGPPKTCLFPSNFLWISNSHVCFSSAQASSPPAAPRPAPGPAPHPAPGSPWGQPRAQPRSLPWQRGAKWAVGEKGRGSGASPSACQRLGVSHACAQPWARPDSHLWADAPAQPRPIPTPMAIPRAPGLSLTPATIPGPAGCCRDVPGGWGPCAPPHPSLHLPPPISPARWVASSASPLVPGTYKRKSGNWKMAQSHALSEDTVAYSNTVTVKEMKLNCKNMVQLKYVQLLTQMSKFAH